MRNPANPLRRSRNHLPMAVTIATLGREGTLKGERKYCGTTLLAARAANTKKTLQVA